MAKIQAGEAVRKNLKTEEFRSHQAGDFCDHTGDRGVQEMVKTDEAHHLQILIRSWVGYGFDPPIVCSRQ
jgi:hypothetical protein